MCGLLAALRQGYLRTDRKLLPPVHWGFCKREKHATWSQNPRKLILVVAESEILSVPSSPGRLLFLRANKLVLLLPLQTLLNKYKIQLMILIPASIDCSILRPIGVFQSCFSVYDLSQESISKLEESNFDIVPILAGKRGICWDCTAFSRRRSSSLWRSCQPTPFTRWYS